MFKRFHSKERSERSVVVTEIQNNPNFDEPTTTAKGILKRKQELKDLDNTALQALNERLIAEAQFNADLKINGLARVEAKREALQLEQDLELARLQQIINNAAEGTQARADAEAEFLAKKTAKH